LTKVNDITPVNCSLYFLPVETRVPLKFGAETLTSVTCARVKMRVQKADGQIIEGWGETPLSVQWVWPSQLSYAERHTALKDFCLRLADAWGIFEHSGHAMEVGHAFQKEVLPSLLVEFNQERSDSEPMPWLAALVCCSAFDIALHDAYGVANQKPVYQTYAPPYMDADLSRYLQSAESADVDFKGTYPADFFVCQPPVRIPAWHLVGGLDPISDDELSGDEPDDGYPVLLQDWIERDGLNCLKVKLRGTDYEWDYQRLVRVGEVAIENDVDWLTTDFNSTVLDPAYVNAILDQLVIEHPRIYGMILYVEQPFPYELEKHQIDVHSVSARKPLFMDESAHDWELVRLGRSLGWTGVALKTCKTQTGALLSLCWAKAHGMTLMVQDLTNPMLAQIPHVLLAAHTGTIMGVETNAMQFYPEASNTEAVIHPGLYHRRDGHLDLSSISGPGFGYRLNEIERQLPEPEIIE
jgi:L-alanine-DL-glutamate epimerase-like enolase superfamily enzyme